MLVINYNDILNAEDTSFAISYQRQLFINDFIESALREDNFDDMKSLMELYDSYWNSRMDILVKHGMNDQFAIKDIVRRSIVEASFSHMLKEEN